MSEKCKYDVIFVVSNQDRSGKSTFAKALGEALGLKVGETGHCIDEPLARVMTAADDQGRSFECNREWLETKSKSARWAKRIFGGELCRIDPAWMVKQCLKDGARIVVGCRRSEEIAAWMNSCGAVRAKLFIVYRGAVDSIEPATEFLKLQLPTVEIANCGTVDELIEDAKMAAAACV